MSTRTAPRKCSKQADSNAQSEAFTTRRTLPDEIVKEILVQSPGLTIPFDLFIKNDRVSPFADTSHISSSSILVVCKQWLRVATPLLYHTVIIRSKAQGQALERAVCANRDFAKFIKRIRIEIAYGLPMRTILPLATNITDICITLDVFGGDNPGGLIKTLPLLRPTTLILHDFGCNTSNHSAIAFRSRVGDCIRHHWSTLTQVYLPSNQSWAGYPQMQHLATALSLATSLRALHIDKFSSLTPSFWNTVSVNETLTQINVLHDFVNYYFFSSNKNVRKLIRIRGQPLDGLGCPIIATPVISACARFDDHIWKRTLQLSMELEIPLDKITTSDCTDMLTQRLKWYSQVVRLCKRFHRLGIPYLYRFPYIHNYVQLSSFVRHVGENPDLASHIKLLLFSDSYDPSFATDHTEPQFVKNLQAIMKNVRVGAVGTCSTSVQACSGCTMSWTAFKTLCESSSHTLTHLHPVHASPPSLKSLLTVFACLNNVRFLHWRSDAAFGSTFKGSDVPSTCFPLLEYLEYEEDVSSKKTQRILLDVMSHMTLPYLRSFRLTLRERGRGPDVTSFLTAHGSKITTLALPFAGSGFPLQSCPNVNTLIDASYLLNWKLQDTTIFFSSHSSLKTIIYEIHLSALRSRATNVMTLFYPSIYKRLTSLEEIQIQNMQGKSIWPTTDHEMESNRNIWPGRAKVLAEAGIKLTDCHGKHWTPRLEKQPEKQRKRRTT